MVILLLLLTPAAVQAQHPAGVALARIRPGAVVRVDVAGRERLEGQLRGVTADTLFLATERGAQWVALDRIEVLYERGRATKTAAIVGAVAGGVTVGSVVTLACAIGRSDDGVIGNENQWADCAAVGGVLGGAGGAAIGAGIGSLIPKWHVRFRSHR